ncbi:MAG: TRAP transporter small permease subunit [Gammaproteobacteria bacterium]|nr:TRAP transporter small permease subunit [Gammaproteobacteria bacterium]
MQPDESVGGRVVGFLQRCEDLLLALLLTTMIALACTQIVLRNVVETSLLWIDPLLRAMVLWLGLLGAMVASRNNRHIAIDLLTRFAGETWRRWLVAATSGFTSAVCALIAVHGARLVRFEYVDRTLAFAGIPVWALEIIIPIAFAIIAVRYVGYGVTQWRAAEVPDQA